MGPTNSQVLPSIESFVATFNYSKTMYKRFPYSDAKATKFDLAVKFIRVILYTNFEALIPQCCMPLQRSGETLLLLLIIIIIISASNPLISSSFHFSWNPKYNDFGHLHFGFQLKLTLLLTKGVPARNIITSSSFLNIQISQKMTLIE